MKFRRPWINPPSQYSLGTDRGSWRFVVPVIVLIVIAAIVGLVLVRTGQLSNGWTYVFLPIAGIGAFASMLLTIFKGASESKQG